MIFESSRNTWILEQSFSNTCFTKDVVCFYMDECPSIDFENEIMGRVKEFNELEALDKALELFWIKGYNATSASDLVEALGLSRSSLYGTFGDKRSLFIQALDRYRQRNVRVVLKMIETSDDLCETVREIYRMAIRNDLLLKIPKGCLMVNTSIEMVPHDEEIAQIIQSNETDILNAFEAAIQKGQQAEQITDRHSSSSLANFIYNNLTGFRVATRARVQQESLEDVIEICMATLRK